MIQSKSELDLHMKSGVFDYTVNGECSNCGQCCTDFLPISESDLNAIRRYLAKHKVPEHKHVPPTAQPTVDITCPFRDDLNRRCEIYPVRPAICREFRCDKPKRDIWFNQRKYAGMYSVVNMRETFFGKEEP